MRDALLGHENVVFLISTISDKRGQSKVKCSHEHFVIYVDIILIIIIIIIYVTR